MEDTLDAPSTSSNKFLYSNSNTQNIKCHGLDFYTISLIAQKPPNMTHGMYFFYFNHNNQRIYDVHLFVDCKYIYNIVVSILSICFLTFLTFHGVKNIVAKEK